MRVETLRNVDDSELKERLCDAVKDGAVKFEATKNANGTWTVKKTFEG